MPLPTRRAFVEQIMGIPVSVHLRGASTDAERKAAADNVFSYLRRIDVMFSTYRFDSEISRLNRAEISIEHCSPLVKKVIDLCEVARERTAGYFDAWYSRDRAEYGFDPSGLVKGWAIEQAARYLAPLDDDYYLSGGGDIVLRATETNPWVIGIEDPHDPNKILTQVERSTGAVATSGPAHRGDHIIDPFTGAPADGIASVTIIGPSLVWADVYATATVAAGPTRIDSLATLDGYSSLVVLASGATQVIGEDLPQ